MGTPIPIQSDPPNPATNMLVKRLQAAVPGLPSNNAELQPDDVRLLYSSYGDWGRHSHNLVWVETTFGIAGVVGGLYAIRDLPLWPFTIGTAVCLWVLIVTHWLGLGNRKQWSSAIEVQNLIEQHYFRVRGEPEQDKRPRALVEPRTEKSKLRRAPRVQVARELLLATVAVVVVLAAVARWIG